MIQPIKYITVATLSLLATLTCSAQLRLPDSHNKAHQQHSATKDLLASHADIRTELGVLNYLQGLQREDAAVNGDIYEQNWESDRVNPYLGVTIPATMDIDVSGYVAPVRGRVTSNYGYRSRFRRMHKGIDMSLHVGDTVVAAFDGKVRLAKYERKGYGYYLVIRHDNGMETVYGHLSKFIVKPDDRVRAGDPIALGGNTGRSTGPHLHFETRFMGVPINPAEVIDFENKVPINGTFAFDKAKAENAVKYTRKKATTRKRTTASSTKSRARRK